MRIFHLTFILCLSVLFTSSCKNKKNEQKEASEEHTNVDKEHSTKNSIDWEGTYFGVVPCSSCPGINTLVTLNNDGTFQRSVDEIGSGKEAETSTGKIEWSVNESIVNIDNHFYFIAENQLIALDAELKKHEGENADAYLLNKTNFSKKSETTPGYTVQNLKDNKGSNYTLVFNTNTRVPSVCLIANGMKKVLSQTQAWAKGGEYASGNTKIIAKDNKVTITTQDKTIELQ